MSTRRVVRRFADLLPDEVADLFLCAHQVGPVVQRVFGGTSLTISMQVMKREVCLGWGRAKSLHFSIVLCM